MEKASRPTAVPDLESSLRRDKPRESTLSRQWRQNLDPTHADLVCLLLCFLAGLCDSSAYNVWSCFLGMQTGNTIFLGLGASALPKSKPWGWLKSLVSIVSFFTGAMIFSTIMRRVGTLRRGTLFVSFLVQTILIIIAAVVIQADLIPHTSTDMSLDGGQLFLELIPIGLLAFQSAGAMTCSRSLGFNEIPTVVLTSVYFDIASEPRIAEKSITNVKRNSRIGGVVSLLIGAIVGGWLSRSSGSMESALWMAAGLKFVAAVGWLFWKAAAPN
ncbi:hypothetical protein N7448_009011 [Penicillium atrosanguineum]|uniref:DUF1275 domain protein n=1 Tax=Penicillium atrosanguineum TaxID=1132637 RepID=A0A9W9GK40_9EURO|nr:high-affinity nicotinic acid transporter-like protein [Penicillium atrosanguineum]KAJ5122914.1 hypothetical protein N7448_009011 [Penicillium atrosanguineum]KAJ5137214.1 hypothetical protein N7526_003447 [Penicillium atrosanguineum]KAJ5298137.1 high-affinity nicotinic acid transporter-like protein [Penicillium atrosanguineum]KAJ5321594.1 hypothetical protein N7476_004596 [Penicillium atrosanguineum]